MPNMLMMTTFKLGDPVPFFILVMANNRTQRYHQSVTKVIVLQG